jgi:CRP/FNR family transcriptional regulator
MQKLFESCTRHQWIRGQVLFRADDPATNLYRVTSGVVAVSLAVADARRQIVAFLLTGDICGFVQTDGRYGFDREAITETTTCAIPMSRVHELTLSNPNVAEAMKTQMSRAHNRVAEQLVAVGQLDAKERVVYFLSRLEKSYADRGMLSHPLLLPMTRADIADNLGMRIETLSRVLRQLQSHGVIDLQGVHTVVLKGAASELVSAARASGSAQMQ